MFSLVDTNNQAKSAYAINLVTHVVPMDSGPTPLQNQFFIFHFLFSSFELLTLKPMTFNFKTPVLTRLTLMGRSYFVHLIKKYHLHTAY